MASIFTVNEEDLFNFENFCDSKYMDANVQKYGFFKIKLDSTLDGQCSTVFEFFKQFGLLSHAKIRKSILLRNPNSSNLFGLQNVRPTSAEKDHFISLGEQLAKMDSNDVSPNCCMQALEHGEDNFLQHFFNKVTCNTKMLERSCRDDVSCIRRRAVANSIAYQKRQSYEKATTMEGKKRSLTMAMLSEEIVDSSHSPCVCDSCNTKYSFKHTTKSLSGKEEDFVSLYSAGIEESRNNYLHLTNNFAMAHLCFKNMMSSLDSVFNGVSFPALYQGGSHSVFPIHTEDLSCWSFNFVLHGFPKFWLMVPPTSVSRLTDALQRRGFHGLHRWCRNTLNHKFYIPTPEFFREENIPFELVIQQQGEGIVVLPNTAHSGGNLGPNLAEACNFGSYKWIPYGCVSPNCPCMEDNVHADLSDIVAVHEPNLLQAYIDNDIVNVVEDQYFQKSILVPKKDSCCGSTSTQPMDRVDFSSERKKLQVKNSRIKCPVCDVSWAYVQKGNMVKHIVKYHNYRIEEQIVTKFIDQYSLTIK